MKKPIVSELYEKFFSHKLFVSSNKFKYLVKIKKNRKNISNIRPGVSLNNKKNSIKRDKNFTLLQQYININLKKGGKITVFKNLDVMFENLSICLSNELSDFKHLKNYDKFVYYFNNNPIYSDLNGLLLFIVSGLESVFEIKTSKNNKKLKLKTKYSHEIIYIPKERRLKYVLKALSFYKECFKNYSL